MGILGKLFGGAKGPREVEHDGGVIEAWLEVANVGSWDQLMEGKAIRNRWASLRTEPNRNGRPKLVVSVDGRVVGELAAAKLAKAADLAGALDAGVNVGVVSLRKRGETTKSGAFVGEAEAALFLGKGYKYRPAASWD